MSDHSHRPLEGITVVAFEQAVAVPYCSRLLSDLGARVVKVEHPAGGDFVRDYDAAVNGLAAHFVWLNRNKESIALDVKHPRAKELLDRLLASADVALQNLAPGAAARLGIAASQLVERFPRLVAVDVSGYGNGGPYDHKRAYDLLVQAESGSCSITGTPDSPAKSGPPVADLGTSMHIAVAVLAALFDRTRTGKGTAIEIAMFDVMADFMGFALQYTRGTGEERQPIGMGSPMIAPYRAFPTADGQTVVFGTTNDREWVRLARDMLGRPDLASDPAYAHNEQRCAARDVIDAAITEWTERHTLAEAQEAADRAGIGNSRYNTVSDVIVHPQLAQRGRWRDVGSTAGPLATVLAPQISRGWEPRLDPIPGLGEHTDSILAGLGYTDEEIADFRTESVVGAVAAHAPDAPDADAPDAHDAPERGAP